MRDTSPSSSSTDMLSHAQSPSATSGAHTLNDGSYGYLVDPVTGFESLGGSRSGKEAARVVKFSPEGSERDLLVFSEVSRPFASGHISSYRMHHGTVP
jgi:hypothetical protein